MNKDISICTYQIGEPSPKYMAPIINCKFYSPDGENINVILNKKDYETLKEYAYMGQIQQEKLDNKQQRIDKALKIIKECKMLMSHEFDWEEQIDNIEVILKGENNE